MSLKNILSLKNLYLFKSSLDSSISLTPFSQQIKQNIANEWIRSNRRMLSLELFTTPMVQSCDPMTRTQISSLKNNYEKHFSHWCDTTSQPIGIIEKFVCLKDNEEKSILDSNKSDFLVFALICPKQQSLQLFQKIQANHKHWFRDLSKSPLNSQFSMIQNNQDSIQWDINHKIEEIDHKVEELLYYSDSSVQQKFGITDCDLILCNLDLDNSLLSFLCDAFSLRTCKNGKTVKKLKLNSSLAPIKIAFTFRESTQINDQMIRITKYLIEMLNEFEIPVLPFFPNKLVPIESCDELGIPFVVIVDEENMEKGVLALRNRDTDIEEWVHISNFQKTVCLHLKKIHPSIVRNKAMN